MANTIRYFRDNLTIDLDLIARLGARTGDTVVIDARHAVLTALAVAPLPQEALAA